MRARHLVPFAFACAFVAAGCTGGSGGSGAPVAPIQPGSTPSPTPAPTAVPTATPTPAAAFVLNIVIPNAGGGAGSSAGRAPQYVSQGTASVAAYDGTALIYVGNVVAGTPPNPPSLSTVYAKVGTTTVTGGSCTAGATSTTCSIALTTSPGAHAFDVITYPLPQGGTQTGSGGRAPHDIGTAPATFNGVILSEGELAVTLASGSNAAQTISLLGVAFRATFTPPVLTLHLNGTGPLVGIIGTTYTFGYVIADSAGYQITTPGAYDNGPVTIAETDGGGIVTMTPISQATPPSTTGTQSFTVTCAANGTATITASAKTRPNATYASALTYTSANYASATLGTTTLQCVPNSATLPVTVQ